MNLKVIIREREWQSLVIATAIVYMIPLVYLLPAQEVTPSILAVQIPVRILVALLAATLMFLAVRKLRKRLLQFPIISALMLWAPYFAVPWIPRVSFRWADLIITLGMFAGFGLVIGVIWDVFSRVYSRLKS